ncbi:MAG: hypothetical protein LBH14_02985 [Desulfobulbaceae bacterium]|nr:hypothetical protein [Desulfobulbaceae bacterium]
MKIQILALIVINALLVSMGSILMRYGGKNLDWSQGLIAGVLNTGKLWLAGMVMCWIAGLFFALLLTKNELVTSFIAYYALTFIFIALGGYFLLGEHFSLAKSMGVILTLFGIYVLMRG